MKFLSIKEFFYKLNTIGFILLLLPMLVFVFLYYRPIYDDPMIVDEGEINRLLYGVGAIFLITLTTVNWVKSIRVKKLKLLIELSRKMDGYADIFLLRMSTYAVCSLIAASGFYLTYNIYFTTIFILILFISLIQWPSRSSFSRLFDLNSNERQMIMTNGDTITRRKVKG